MKYLAKVRNKYIENRDMMLDKETNSNSHLSGPQITFKKSDRLTDIVDNTAEWINKGSATKVSQQVFQCREGRGDGPG